MLLSIKKLSFALTLCLFWGCCAWAQSGGESLVLGNPSRAANDDAQPDDFLLVKPQFILSYNKTNGGPNWVSWHTQASDLGTVDRLNDFRPDAALPAEWRIKPSAYARAGYDRGHICPSADRTASRESNSATFLMTNILPQKGDLNRFAWKKLEDYTRRLVKQKREVYVLAGGYGSKEVIGSGTVNAPARFWKVIVVLPEGGDDLQRINRKTRVIAVDVPNEDGIKSASWQEYLTTVDEIETATGYDLLSRVPVEVQAVIEAKRDNAREMIKRKLKKQRRKRLVHP